MSCGIVIVLMRRQDWLDYLMLSIDIVASIRFLRISCGMLVYLRLFNESVPSWVYVMILDGRFTANNLRSFVVHNWLLVDSGWNDWLLAVNWCRCCSVGGFWLI